MVADAGPPRPPDLNVAPRVVAANALIDCTTRIRVFSDLNIEMGGRGGVALRTADPRNLAELPNAHPSRWCKDSGINRLGPSPCRPLRVSSQGSVWSESSLCFEANLWSESNPWPEACLCSDSGPCSNSSPCSESRLWSAAAPCSASRIAPRNGPFPRVRCAPHMEHGRWAHDLSTQDRRDPRSTTLTPNAEKVPTFQT